MTAGDHYLGHSNFDVLSVTNATAIVIPPPSDPVAGSGADLDQRMLVEGFLVSSRTGVLGTIDFQWWDGDAGTTFMTVHLPVVAAGGVVNFSESMTKFRGIAGQGLRFFITGAITLTAINAWGRRVYS